MATVQLSIPAKPRKLRKSNFRNFILIEMPPTTKMLRHYKFSTPITRGLRINAKNEQNFIPVNKLYSIKSHKNKYKRSNMVFLFYNVSKSW